MLKEIYIQNYALMDELRVGFPGKMTVITGETGAGKSILLGALGLILGKRADTSVLNDKSKKCIVEAVFKINTYRLQDFFKTNDLDYSDETTMRRELSIEGKSRAFINDTPVNLNLMKALGELLIDIHSQHETLMLSEKNFRFDVMDAFAKVEPELVLYRDLFKKFKNKERILEQLKKDYSNVKKDQDYFSFQLSELEEFNLNGIDFDSIKNLSIALENSEFIKGNLSSASETIAGGEKNILNSLSLVKQLLSQIKKYGNDYAEFESRLNTVILELKELERDLSSYSDRIEYNSEKLDELNEKIDRINKLFIKHQVTDLPALIHVRDEISNKLQSTESLEKDISKLEKELSSDLSSLKDQAAKISLKRKNKTVELQKSIEQILDKLNMPNARFKV
ncbi:MAG: DNA repair protein RecN, partial [Bacteroidota bacterium]